MPEELTQKSKVVNAFMDANDQLHYSPMGRPWSYERSTRLFEV
jgi:hypothetical protein